MFQLYLLNKILKHNGGGVGWGEVTNGGFGLVLDGSEDADRIAESMLTWDVYNGVARRSWSGNDNAIGVLNFLFNLKIFLL
jgi:urocanate hydratase